MLVTAPTMPETHVPWPLSSVGSPSLFTKSQPDTSFPCRSGWERSTPVSSTAMMTPGEPVVTSQAAVARVVTGDHSLSQ